MQDLNQFNVACEQLLSGKYILIDIKISSILKIIDGNEKLKNIVSSSLNQYDFSSLLSTELNENLVLPSGESEIVSFVYSFLFKLKNNELNLGDDSAQTLSKIILKIIPNFQTAINSLYNKNHEQVEADEYQQNIYNNIKTTIKIVLENLDKYKFSTTNKEEFLMLANSLYSASENNNKKLVYSLMIGLDYFTQCNKKLRSIYLSLEECFSN